MRENNHPNGKFTEPSRHIVDIPRIIF